MSNEFANFVNKQTGEVVYLPKHYETLFPETLELTDADVECTTCNLPEQDLPEEEVAPEEEPFVAPTEIDITEPAKRSRRRNSGS